MDFGEDTDHLQIRHAIRSACAQFPDEYWADADSTHTFPWAFYQAMAREDGSALPSLPSTAVAAPDSPRHRSSWRKWPRLARA